MTLVTLEKITRSFGADRILDGLSLRIDEGERIGVIGDNGAGKTTMVKILAGVDDADTGQRNGRRDLRIAYGAQMPVMPQGTTVMQFATRGTGEHDVLEQRMRSLEAKMATGSEAAIADYGRLQAAFEAGGGYDHGHQVEKVLEGLGFDEAARQKDVSVLSGGERSRAQLAVLMTSPADLLILDEPTNHLDLAGIEYVEDFIRRYPGAVLAVSHDRTFLDAIATSILVVNNGIATRFKGNFSQYAQQRDLELLSQARQYKNQREFVDKEMEFIRRNMAGRNSAQAKGRLKRLQRLQLIDKPKGKRAAMRLTLGTAKGMDGQTVIEVEDLTVRAGPRTLIEHGEFRVYFGETVALLGRNGAGKTTLLKLISGLGTKTSGTIKRLPNLRIGYFSQEKTDLPQQGTVLEALRDLDRTIDERALRDHLALFLFCGDDVEKPVSELSGGEKQRLSLARLLRSEFDLLCMDEPTNHLDVAGTEGLEQALKEFPGTIVLITHDRKLVDEVADRVLWVEDGKIRNFERGLEQCQRTLALERSAARLAEVEAREKAAKKTQATAAPAAKAIETGKVRNPLMFQKLEERIMILEDELKTARAAMMLPDNYASVSKMKELQQQEVDLQRKLAEAYESWENWQ
ncbi:MAG: ABC-F family ATP-binding cassette domain-containing protein [Planctomycetota bacterium]|nr:ABC-F family ATP-binding cassette domain-containing protein [Planctomycetota bacterium]MSR39504.1 ABC transporter ATP-binding protein [Planctomycetota bacterium]